MLQAVPKEVKLEDLKREISKIPGVKEYKNLNVWRLDQYKIIGTVDILMESMENWDFVRSEIDKISEKFKIYKFTVTPNIK